MIANKPESAVPEPPEAARQYDASPAPTGAYLRHAWPVRVMHWLNVISFTAMLMSGLMVFNAHPALDWGKSSYTGSAPFLEITTHPDASGKPAGLLRIFGHEFVTTGVLGLSKRPDGTSTSVAFPTWATLPGYYSLAEARLWHFFFAWVLVLNGLGYVAYGLFSRHLQRDLRPTPRDWRGFGQSIRDHLAFRHPRGEAAKHYNVLQKLVYLLVIFGLFPLIVLTGWAMSPWLNSLFGGWVDLFGGRQSARALHFLAALLLVGFVLVHVFEVLISGPWNQLRSMVTGRYVIPKGVEARIAEEPGHE